MRRFSESVVEDAALDWLKRLGWAIKHGPQIAPGELAAERTDFGQVVLENGCAMRWRSSIPRCRPRRSPTLFANSPGPKARRWKHAIARCTACSWMA